MGFIVFEEEAFNYLDAQLENFVKRMDRIRERSEDKTINKWLDTQDVCQMLNTSAHGQCRHFGTTELWLIRKSATRPTASRRT